MGIPSLSAAGLNPDPNLLERGCCEEWHMALFCLGVLRQEQLKKIGQSISILSSCQAIEGPNVVQSRHYSSVPGQPLGGQLGAQWLAQQCSIPRNPWQGVRHAPTDFVDAEHLLAHSGIKFSIGPNLLITKSY